MAKISFLICGAGTLGRMPPRMGSWQPERLRYKEMAWLIPRDELVQVEEHAAQRDPGGGFGLRHAFQSIGEEGGHGPRVGEQPAAGFVEILAHALGLARRGLAAERDGVGVVEACLLYTSPSPRDRTRSRMPS